MTFRHLLLVALGGAFGSVLRYAGSGWAQRLFPATIFPVGTFVVNLTGSLLIGLVAGLVEYRQLIGPGPRLFLVVGILGGYTTFSAFSLETVILLREGQASMAALNVLAQVALGVGAAFAGFFAARSL